MWMDIGKLIRESVPDKNGHTLPADLNSGSYAVRDLSDNRVGTLFEGKVVYDKTYGHVTYGCAACCGWGIPYLWYNPISVIINAFQDDGVWADYPCESEVDDVSSTFYNTWNSDATSIVTVDYMGTHNGVSLGSTSSYCSANLASNNAHENCPALFRTPTGGANVTPSITSVSPSRGLIGATTSSVTITGTGLSGAHVDLPSTMSYSNLDYVDDQHLTFNLTISSTATTGNNTGAIYVDNAGEDSNKEDFYVQVPTSLSMVAGSASGTAERLCNSITCGTIVSFKYQVYDQDSPAQPIRNVMSIWDSFGSYSPDGLNLQGAPVVTTCSPNQTNSGPCNVNTLSDGTFTEAALGACATVCCVGGACTTGGPSDVPQTWHIASSSIVQQISEYCEKILVNGTQVQ
jgi:hypothetical protein